MCDMCDMCDMCILLFVFKFSFFFDKLMGVNENKKNINKL